MISMLFGRAFDEWAKVNSILEANGIDTPEELEEALDPWPKKIPVHDSKNKSRLLGHLHDIRRPNLRTGNSIRMALSVPVSRCIAPWEEQINISMKSVEFFIDKETKDGWVFTPVLTTSSPLDDLMKLRQFTLPGETRKQADERLYRSNLL